MVTVHSFGMPLKAASITLTVIVGVPRVMVTVRFWVQGVVWLEFENWKSGKVKKEVLFPNGLFVFKNEWKTNG
jgi:hypothetical protein